MLLNMAIEYAQQCPHDAKSSTDGKLVGQHEARYT